MRDLFLLDPEVVFLNHGSFGACPRPVFEAYQDWQRQLERQPVEFLGRRIEGLLEKARSDLGVFVGAKPENLTFVHNATGAINMVARSLNLRPGEEVLTTDHEYGACDMTWDYLCAQSGASYVRASIPLPISGDDEFLEHLWAAVTPRTRVIFISHLTSPTGVIFPVKEVCRRAREAGIVTVIDGAHAPGQLPLDLETLGADYYTGNLHKWLNAPKGSALLYVRPEHQTSLIPLVISWGFQPGATLAARTQWMGTEDPSAYLSVSAAIAFQNAHDWPSVRARCHQLAVTWRDKGCALYQQPPLAPESWLGQMAAIRLPERYTADQAPEIKRRLYDEYRVEVPVIVWGDRVLVRASFQGYNTAEDGEALLQALSSVAPKG
ncbi:isopenicillin-N epimerase [Anaerolineae bacterium]|nr:isopenicillin-N epimerase [Anaerolineae bacterium]